MIWYDMAWFGMTWHGLAFWYDMTLLCTALVCKVPICTWRGGRQMETLTHMGRAEYDHPSSLVWFKFGVCLLGSPTHH